MTIDHLLEYENATSYITGQYVPSRSLSPSASTPEAYLAAVWTPTVDLCSHTPACLCNVIYGSTSGAGPCWMIRRVLTLP